MSAAGSKNERSRSGRDDPSPEKKKKKVIVWRHEDPDAWVISDADLAKMKRDRESAPRPVKIPTIDYFKPPTWFHTAEVFAVRDSSDAVLSAAKSLLWVSSSLDGEPLRRCSGFWVDWDEEKKAGLVLTTVWLIRTKDAPSSVWSGGEEYAPHADVTVHLLNGTSAKGTLVYYQPHYDIAFLNVEVDQPIKLPTFREKDVKFAEDVFRLGRDNSLDLRITYARAEYRNPNMYRRYHNVHFRSPDGHGDDNEYDNGGLVIDLKGKVVGMVNLPKRFGSFIPSSILLSCLDSWKKYRCIARPHLGMMFEAIKLLEPAHVDMLWRMYNIDYGLIVQEVSKGSNAEILGIQKGDVIECINGKPVSTTIELENTLMSTCKGPSGAEVHISGVPHAQRTTKHRRVECKIIKTWRSYHKLDSGTGCQTRDASLLDATVMDTLAVTIYIRRFLRWGRRPTRLRPRVCGHPTRPRPPPPAPPHTTLPLPAASPLAALLPTRSAHAVADAPRDPLAQRDCRSPPPSQPVHAKLPLPTRGSLAPAIFPLQGRCTRRGIWMRWLPRSTLPSTASGTSLNYKRLDKDTEILSYALFKEKGTQLPIVQVLLDK